MPLPTARRVRGLRDVGGSTPGVWFPPGEWLYADEDGIVVSTRALT